VLLTVRTYEHEYNDRKHRTRSHEWTFGSYLRISNKYGSLTRNKFQKCHYFEITWRTFKIRIASKVSNWRLLIGYNSVWQKNSECEIDVSFQEKFLTNESLDMIGSILGHILMFGWVFVSRQFHFHSYYIVLFPLPYWRVTEFIPVWMYRGFYRIYGYIIKNKYGSVTALKHWPNQRWYDLKGGSSNQV
jgi:hypothetical protein